MNINCVFAIVLCTMAMFILSAQVSADIKGWYAPSALKVFRDAKAQKTESWQMNAAKNEVESCQLVLLSSRPVADVSVTVTDLQNTKGRGILKADLFKVEYVEITDKKIPYPDPLPPLMKPFDLAANQAQPVWISVRVPKDAAKGLYEGQAIVKAGGEKLSFPLKVSVWGFTLPDTPTSDTAFGISSEHIARTHGTKSSSELAGLYARYYEMLLDHKISAYSIPVDLSTKDADKYLNDPRMTSYCIPFPSDDAEVKKVAEKLRAGGWMKKGYYYPIDEPFTAESLVNFNNLITRLKTLVPDYHIVTPFFRNPDFGNQTVFDYMTGNVNIWCPNSNFYDTEPKTQSYLDGRKKLGEKEWWYVCCGPGDPYNNFFVNMPAMSHRVLFWQQKKMGVEGLLYWSTTWWNAAQGVEDPWTNMMTVPEINKNIFGDGSLMYPGKKVGIDGPVSSLRLEMAREGIEDFDYLTIGEKVLGAEAVKGYINQIARTLTDWEKDPMKLEAVRKELGNAIDKASK